MKGTIYLSNKEVHRARVLDRVINGLLTLKKASELLDVTYRQAKRLK